MRARERDGLFDIVSCFSRVARPHPQERACEKHSSNSTARARVSKDEGEGARRILAKRTQSSSIRSSPRKRIGAKLRNVSRAQRSTSEAKWCAADRDRHGSVARSRISGAPLHFVSRCTASGTPG
jgi:hypothetical protein